MDIHVRPLTAETFAFFGQLIDLQGNTAASFSADHFNYWKQLGILKDIDEVEVGLLKVKRHEMTCDRMERHEQTPELLIPITGSFIITVGMPAKTIPDVAGLSAFHVRSGQAILLKPDCWHWMPNPVEEESAILIIFKNNTSQNDTIIEPLEKVCTLINA